MHLNTAVETVEQIKQGRPQNLQPISVYVWQMKQVQANRIGRNRHNMIIADSVLMFIHLFTTFAE